MPDPRRWITRWRDKRRAAADDRALTLAAQAWAAATLKRAARPRRHHDFVLGPNSSVDYTLGQWYTVQATCRICGEQRRVYHAVDPYVLNLGPCPRVPEVTPR